MSKGSFFFLGCLKFVICLLFDWFSMYMSSARFFLSVFAALSCSVAPLNLLGMGNRILGEVNNVGLRL